MAGIDKTYTNSYSEYKELKNWCQDKVITFFDGSKEFAKEAIYNWDVEDFDGRELPIMNTPTWFDIFLIQNCPVQFVIDRMKVVYSEETFNELLTTKFPAPIPEGYQRNRKVSIKRIEKSVWPIHDKPIRHRDGWQGKWWVQCDDFDFNYNEYTKVWSSREMRYPHYNSTAHIKTLRGVVRHLKKQYLPKGIKFRIIGRYIGEEYVAVVN